MTRSILRRLSWLAAAIAVAAVAPGARAQDISGEDRPLVVVSYGGPYQEAQRQVYFEPFRKASGIAMTDAAWDGGLAVLGDRMHSGAPRWDVVQVDGGELVRGCAEGLFVNLDWSRIGGQERYLPEAVSPCGVGAIVYGLVLAYNRNKLPSPPQSWADFFDTQAFPGKRALHMGPRTTLEIALLGDGVAAADVYTVLATPEGADRAFSKLDAIKDDLVFWSAAHQPTQFLAAGEVIMSSAYNTQIDAANRNDDGVLGMVWAGALNAIDWWVILAGSAREAEAYRFIEFAGEGDNQARLPQLIAYGIPNRQANAAADPQQRGHLPSAPENMKSAVMISEAFWQEHRDSLTERFNSWAAMK